MDDAALIVVRRPPGGYRDLLRSYWIEVDGVRVGRVGRGAQADFVVSPLGHQRAFVTKVRDRATMSETEEAPRQTWSAPGTSR